MVDWLEAIFEDSEDFFRQEILWRHTLHTLRNSPNSKFENSTVSDIDPDATARQRKNLHRDDMVLVLSKDDHLILI